MCCVFWFVVFEESNCACLVNVVCVCLKLGCLECGVSALCVCVGVFFGHWLMACFL